MANSFYGHINPILTRYQNIANRTYKPGGKYSKLMGYYKDYLSEMYGGKEYLTPEEIAEFSRAESYIEKARGRLGEKAEERGARYGQLGSGVFEETYAQSVTEPIESALASVYQQRLAATTAEKQRRHEEALGFASQTVEEERQKKQGLWGTIGKIAGVGASFIPGVGSLVAPLVSAGVSSIGGGDGYGYTPQYPSSPYQIDWSNIQSIINQLRGNSSQPYEMPGTYPSEMYPLTG